MTQYKSSKTRPVHHHTFHDHLEALRLENAARAFSRGRLASELRHFAAATSQRRSARTLSRLKQQALRAAFEIAPDYVRVGLDDDLHVGMLSVAFPGMGRLHLPPTCLDPAA